MWTPRRFVVLFCSFSIVFCVCVLHKGQLEINSSGGIIVMQDYESESNTTDPYGNVRSTTVQYANEAKKKRSNVIVLSMAR